MRRLIVSVLTLIFVLGASSESYSQNFSKGKFILGVYENALFVKGESPQHDHLSFTAAFINGKNNHHEISLNNLSTGKNKFGIGIGYQYKWQWLKKLPVNPYIGFYNNVIFDSENILGDDQISNYTIRLNSGVAPGLNASIGRIFIDGSVRLDLASTTYTKEDKINLSSLTNLDTETLGFKDQLGLRLGVGFKF